MNRNLYLFATALMAGTVGMTSCSNEEIAPNNPTFNGESVKTQFAINIPYGKSSTRMTEDATQGEGADAAFLGMQNIYLVPLNATGSDQSTFTSVIPLDKFENFDNSSANYKLYNDVNIPVGTNHFLFYGVGGTSVPSDPSGKFANGILKTTLPATANAAAVTFNLEQIVTEETEKDFASQQGILLGLLNKVAKVTDWSTQPEDTELGALYQKYITLVGGSAESIRLTMEELYNAVSGINNDIAKNIKGAIESANDGSTDKLFNISNNDGTFSLAWNDEELGKYPTNLNVPEGAAQVFFDKDKINAEEGPFSYDNDPTVGKTDKVVNVYNLCYPASLAYFVNTELRATNNSNVTWPSTAEDWIDEDNWSSSIWGGTAVTATTRTVALKDNIRYGVANLKTTVKCKTSTLEDNAAAVTGRENNQNIVVPTGGFEVTGILVGGQPSVVGWDMTSVDGVTTYDQTIYDNSLTKIVAQYNVASSPNYTLVLDNSKNDTKPVNIALELVNNSGNDFYGIQGKIADGAKFYLVAQLNPEDVTTKPVDLDCVFAKKYQTVANLTISSLKNAYVTIPDLRASELELGLSVDLKWEEGIQFDVEIQ